MYQNYFGLNEQAFSIAVNPRYLYMSRQHKEALAHLIYGVREGGFVMLTGEVGTGKTTIIRCLLEQLPKNTDIAIILNPMANIRELLCTICDEYGIAYNQATPNIKTITDLLHRYLLNNHTKGKNTVLLIDEAQLLSPQVLEQVRLLTNLETASQKLLQIVLVGQPELNELIAQPRLRQLSQRITARFHLTPLTLEETHHYIRHRLSVAGMPEDKNPFSASIVKQIHRFTGGIPRMINIVCERTLVGAYGHNQAQVDGKILERAKKEVQGNRKVSYIKPSHRTYFIYASLAASGIVGLAIIFVLLQLLFVPKDNQQDPVANTASPEQPLAIIRDDATAGDVIGNEPPSDISAADPFSIYVNDRLRAQAVLFNYLEFDVNAESSPCWQIDAKGYKCSTAKMDTWEQLISLNRPSIISLITSNKFRSHAILVGLEDKHAQLLDSSGNTQVVALDTLGPLWTGEVFYAWKKPANYKEALTVGSTNKTVAEVAAQFALLDAQPSPLTTKRFNKALQQRIKIFQREHALTPDGILGERTLMKLNEALGLSKTLNQEFM